MFVFQPLCSDVDSGPSPLGLPGRTHNEPLIETIGNPVKELREAVEMLNDTARERGRSQTHDQSIHHLLSRVGVHFLLIIFFSFFWIRSTTVRV